MDKQLTNEELGLLLTLVRNELITPCHDPETYGKLDIISNKLNHLISYRPDEEVGLTD
jgi:hypothetical protein